MISAERELELLEESLDSALVEADDELARYHIRTAAQRLVILETVAEDTTAGALTGTVADAAERSAGDWQGE